MACHNDQYLREDLLTHIINLIVFIYIYIFMLYKLDGDLFNSALLAQVEVTVHDAV